MYLLSLTSTDILLLDRSRDTLSIIERKNYVGKHVHESWLDFRLHGDVTERHAYKGSIFIFLVPISTPVRFEGAENRNFFWTGDI